MEDKEEYIRKLEEENAKLKQANKILREKLSSVNNRVNRMINDSYNDVTPERDDR